MRDHDKIRSYHAQDQIITKYPKIGIGTPKITPRLHKLTSQLH